jgi:drug/metabolite transporter (DMT)-like permease
VIAHPGIVLAVAATIIYNLGFILEKRALGHLPALDVHRIWELARTLFTAPAWLGGFLLICGGLVLQVLVLSLEPLTVAQPLQASGVVVTILFSRVLLHERLGRAELACMGVICLAVALLSLSSGRDPGAEAGTHAAGVAIAAAAIPACLVVAAIYYRAYRASRRRHGYPATGVSYGLCAGLVYGVAGLALKGLSAAVTAHSRSGLLIAAVTSPYLYMMLGASAAGMCLFQVALQRSPASIVMPISLVISTGYLAVIGSWLFHERLPGSPVLLAMRLTGGVAAVTVPVILTVISERHASRHRVDISRTAPPVVVREPRRDFDEPGPAVARPAGLPDR